MCFPLSMDHTATPALRPTGCPACHSTTPTPPPGPAPSPPLVRHVLPALHGPHQVELPVPERHGQRVANAERQPVAEALSRAQRVGAGGLGERGELQGIYFAGAHCNTPGDQARCRAQRVGEGGLGLGNVGHPASPTRRYRPQAKSAGVRQGSTGQGRALRMW